MGDLSRSTGQGANGVRVLRIAELTALDEFARCVELQLSIWQYDAADLIPRRMFLLARKIGGQVFGAFDDATGQIVAFAMSLAGYRDGRAYLHSHMLAVLPEYRNSGVGRRLKLAQREDAIARGIDLIEWTFDPLEIKNAYLNIARLGAICRRYAPDFYGASSSPLQGGLPTDRLYAEWWLRSERVKRMLEGDAPEAVQTLARVIVPCDVSAWKEDSERNEEALRLQTQNRKALQAAFAQGLAVTGYERTAEGDGVFLLSRPSDRTSETTGELNLPRQESTTSQTASYADADTQPKDTTR